MQNIEKNIYRLLNYIASIMFCLLLLSPVVKATEVIDANRVMNVAEKDTSTGSNKITDINLDENAETISIAIAGNTVLNYMSVKHSLPQEIVLYFPATSMATGNTDFTINNDVISTIKSSEIDGQGRSSITIDLKKTGLTGLCGRMILSA